MESDCNQLTDVIATVAVEHFRFRKIFERILSKIDITERKKYESAFAWYSKNIDKAVSEAGLSLVVHDGEAYSAGLALTPLNIDEFEGVDESDLIVLQTIEPVVMLNGEVYRQGTVILGGKGK